MNAHPEVVLWPQSGEAVTCLIFNHSVILSEHLFMPKTFSGFQNEKLIVIRARYNPVVGRV